MKRSITLGVLLLQLSAIRLCAAPLYLCAFIEISDSTNHSYTGTGDPHDFDNVELYLQLDTNTVDTAYGATTMQLRICGGMDSVQAPGRVLKEDYGLFIDSQHENGWVVEVAIPWKAALEEGAEFEDIVFNYLCNDKTTSYEKYFTLFSIDGIRLQPADTTNLCCTCRTCPGVVPQLCLGYSCYRWHSG